MVGGAVQTRTIRPTLTAAALLWAAAAMLGAPLATSGHATASTIVVDVGGVGDHETIQGGVDAASEGDTVLVYPGTYTGEGNRDIEFGTKNLVLRSRDGALATVIDNTGQGVHRIFDFKKTGQDTTCVIDGFTIKGGHLQDLYVGGAGIRIDGTVGSGPGPASPKFTNCAIRDNYNSLGAGGGVYMNQGPSPVFRNVVFESNYSYTGGAGVYCTWNCAPKFSGCTFVDNQNAMYGYGGGLNCKFSSNAVLVDCWFEGNLAKYGGAVACAEGANPIVTNTTLVANGAGGGGAGGALYCTDGSSPTFSNVTFYGNWSTSDGEALYVIEGSHPVLERCVLASSGRGALSERGGPSSSGVSSERGASCVCDSTSNVEVSQSCSFENVSGDDICGVVCGGGQLICHDPLFCDPAAGDLSVASTSPCLPGNNTWGMLIGAHGEGCSQPSVEATSWGAIKALYR